MFFFAYNILSIFLLLPVVVYHLYRSVSRGRPPAFRERFGSIPAAELAALRKRPTIWLHAVSVGESIAARPLLKALRKRYPGHAIVVSNTTETGRGISSTFPEVDLCIYFPFDFLPSVCSALKSIRPVLIIIMETEIWPNFTREATLRGIPVLLANGRISDRSFDRYMKLGWFFRHPLRLFSNLCMQTEIDRERIIAIGAPDERTLATGNLKYDIPICVADVGEKKRLRDSYTIPEELIVLTAGSTHSGEEQHVITMYKELSAAADNLFLILVPRHPERSSEVAGLLENSGLTFRRRTSLPSTELFHQGEVLLVDTIGEMMSLYALSDISFVGGSLVPTGGHNLLEPASAGVASVFGPHMTNFREITELVLQYGAGIQVDSPEALTASMRTLIASIELRRVLGQNGLKMMRDNGGATERHMEVIAGYL
ncbi:MAG: 3-deoxy-D-manno-octulosonic acid transferase [Deltaproteobacteria bacterium]|jgi:3-deoxy-D-manno-octulosonic-acid transferase|nr:3-deoxy-D-manno-octulosonic acid transferase [Deltaproteobacteria bacterium]